MGNGNARGSLDREENEMRLTKDEQDVLYRAVVLDLSALGDMHKALEQRDAKEAQEYRKHFEDDWALLDAIGWDADAPILEAEFHEAALRAVRHLEKEATSCLVTTAESLRKPPHPMDFEDRDEHLHEWADENLDLQAVCRRIIREAS